MMKSIGLFILMLFGTLFVQAQDVKIDVNAPNIVEEGEVFKIVYTVNKKCDDLKITQVSGMQITGRMQGSSMSSVWTNGSDVTKYVYTFTYTMVPLKVGKYSLPAAIAKVGDKTYKSDEIKLEVIESSNNNSQASSSSTSNDSSNNSDNRSRTESKANRNNLIAESEINRKTVYIGEPLKLTMGLYYNVALSNITNVKFPDFKGFMVQEIKGPDKIVPKRVKYKNSIYNNAEIRKVLLYPQQTGDIKIDSYQIECVVREQVADGDDFMDSFFGNVTSTRVMRASNPLTVHVKPLPTMGKPADFSGAVGQFSVSSSVSTDTIKANDAITYKFKVSGSGNIKLLTKPEIKFPADFEVYDPKVTKNIKNDDSGMSGTVTYEYLVIPRYAGHFSIPEVKFSYFNTSDKKYNTLLAKGYDIRVGRNANAQLNSNNQPVVESFNQQDIKTIGSDIRYIKTGNLNLRDKSGYFYGTSLFWWAFIFPLILFLLGSIVNRRRIAANSDIVRVKNRAANKMSIKRMKAASKAMKANDSSLFYEEVLKALWGYMSYKLNIDRVMLSRDNISDKLKEHGTSDEMIK
ncbi:MAG: BatD family protein, partial [Bacteroidales bacterium]